MGVTKIGNIVPTAFTDIAGQCAAMHVNHVGPLMLPLYPHPPVYAAPYLRGQCRLLQ